MFAALSWTHGLTEPEMPLLSMLTYKDSEKKCK